MSYNNYVKQLLLKSFYKNVYLSKIFQLLIKMDITREKSLSDFIAMNENIHINIHNEIENKRCDRQLDFQRA